MKKYHRGFTLIEALVVIGIIAIIVSMGFPWFISITKSSAITSNVNGFLMDLRFARSEAVRRGGHVVMCRSNAPEASTPVCDGSTPILAGSTTNGWQTGWIIFHDLSGDDKYQSGEPILRVQGAISGVDSMVETGAAYKFIFSPTGRLPLSSATTVTFGGNLFKNSRNDPVCNNVCLQRVVCVDVGGRGRISDPASGGNASCS